MGLYHDIALYQGFVTWPYLTGTWRPITGLSCAQATYWRSASVPASNCHFMDPNVRGLHDLGPSPQLVRITRRAPDRSARLIALIEGSAKASPVDDKGIDPIATTRALCSTLHTSRVLAECAAGLMPAVNCYSPNMAGAGWPTA